MKLVIGLTGAPGSGKETVVDTMKSLLVAGSEVRLHYLARKS